MTNFFAQTQTITGNASVTYDLSNFGTPASYLIGITGMNWSIINQIGQIGAGLSVSLSGKSITVTQVLAGQFFPDSSTSVTLLATSLSNSIVFGIQPPMPMNSTALPLSSCGASPVEAVAMLSGANLAASGSGVLSAMGASVGMTSVLNGSAGAVAPGVVGWGMVQGQVGMDTTNSSVTASLIQCTVDPTTQGMYLSQCNLGPATAISAALPEQSQLSTKYVYAFVQGFSMEQSQMGNVAVCAGVKIGTQALACKNGTITGSMYCNSFSGNNGFTRPGVSYLLVALDPAQTMGPG